MRILRWIVPVFLVAALVAGGFVSGCDRAAPGRQPGPVRVVVTIAPLEGLVRPLLPADAEVRVLIAPGRSEHGYEMTAADVTAMARADLVVSVGLGLEPSVATHLRKHPSPRRIELTFADAAGVSGEAEHDHRHDDHGHDDHAHDDHGHDDHGHDHHGADPHLWLDPKMVQELIPVLRERVVASLERQGTLSAGERGRIEAAEAKLLAEVAEIDESYRSGLAPFAGRAIVTHHSAWGRLAERYGLEVAAVIRPVESSEPTPKAIGDAVRAIRERGVGVIFVEPQFSPQAAQRIADQAGVAVATLDPLGDGDWFKMMRANRETLVENLGR